MILAGVRAVSGPSGVGARAGTSSFALVITFVYITLVNLTLVPLLPMGLGPSEALPNFAIRFDVPNASSEIIRVRTADGLRTVLTHVGNVGGVCSASSGNSKDVAVRLSGCTSVSTMHFRTSAVVQRA